MFGKDQEKEAKNGYKQKMGMQKNKQKMAKKQAEESFKEGEQERLEEIAILEKKIREHVTNT